MVAQAGIAAEPLIRLGAFLGVFVAVALWEALAPRRGAAFARRDRWPHNLGLLLVDVAVLRLAAPGAAIAIAIAGEAHGWGLVNALGLPAWVSIPLAVVALDLAMYFQHVTFHAVPALWRLHRVHHSDLGFDVTTGTRFHPIEILISTLIKMAAVAAIGAPAIAVLVFEVLLNATAMFNHANGRMPVWLDRWVRLVVITPDMHRVHHSIAYNETNSNFGFNLPWWDRFFGTYRAQPAAGHEAMTIGVDAFRTRADLRLDRLLLQPFRDTPGGYAINRRPDPGHGEARPT
ncbi:MAG TPA: sterol desaturase family protein [Burkholderiales bacterium]|nr:sterol desaturase family protein [Burkholderiales bacterium]